MDIYNWDRLPMWRVPALFNQDRVTLKLLYICQQLGLEKPFHIVYGAPKTVFSGGRNAMIERRLSRDEIESYFQAYDHYGVKCYLTFSKWNISDEDLHDEYANLYLSLLEQYQGGVIVSQDKLCEYIRSHYPHITIVASVIKPTFECQDHGSPEYYRSLLMKYDRIVPKPEFILEKERLLELRADASKIELLVNQSCLADCPYARSHYLHYEQCSLYQSQHFVLPCLTEKGKMEAIQYAVNIPLKDLKILQAEGFHHFKLQGRNIFIDEYIDMLGMYIFDPTGPFQSLKRMLLIADGYESYDIRNLDSFYRKINQKMNFYETCC